MSAADLIPKQGHAQRAVLCALLEHGVAGVKSLATYTESTTASIFNAVYALGDKGLIDEAPAEVQEAGRKGARQYGLTAAGIDAALELETETETKA